MGAVGDQTPDLEGPGAFRHQAVVGCLEEDPPPELPERDLRLWYFGDDPDGTPLEVAGVEMRGRRLRVIHLMPLRERYRDAYEEAKRWQEKRSDTR